MANYGEYKRNLYVSGALGCVTNSDASNVYESEIPMDAALARFEAERVEWHESAYRVIGQADGMNENGTVHYAPDTFVTDASNVTAVRVSDGKVHGRFGAESGNTRRQYTFLLELVAAILGHGIRLTAVGTTRNGGRAYVQVSGDVLAAYGMEFRPFYTLGMGQDGSLSVVSTSGDEVIICANMVQSLFGAGALTGARTKQTSRITDAGIITRHGIALGLEQRAERFETGLASLTETTVKNAHWSAFLDEIAPVNVSGASKNIETRNENTRATLTGLYRADARCSTWHGTALGALQAVNTFNLWERGTRGSTDADTRMRDEFLSGKLATAETRAAESLAKVLATA